MTDPILQALRSQIDEIDQQLIECLAKRVQVSTEIASRKRVVATPVLQNDRAAVVSDNYVRLGQRLGLNADFMRKLYRVVHAESCRVQTETLNS